MDPPLLIYTNNEYTLIIVIFIIALIMIVILAYQANVTISLDTDEADIVIIGGGTSSCIAAYRLSQKYPNKSIILLERGKDRRNDPIVYNIANAAKAGYTQPYSETLSTDTSNINLNNLWLLRLTSENPKGVSNAIVSIANMNGGGSSHNFALVVRGSPDFYKKQWRDELHLSYDDLVHQYFPLIEDYHPVVTNDISSVRFQTGKVRMTQLPVTLDIGPRIFICHS